MVYRRHLLIPVVGPFMELSTGGMYAMDVKDLQQFSNMFRKTMRGRI